MRYWLAIALLPIAWAGWVIGALIYPVLAGVVEALDTIDEFFDDEDHYV